MPTFLVKQLEGQLALIIGDHGTHGALGVGIMDEHHLVEANGEFSGVAFHLQFAVLNDLQLADLRVASAHIK